MKLSGHMIIKNGIMYDYPFIQSCMSILPICDEFVFVEGYGDDETYDTLLKLQKRHPKKIKVIKYPWEKQHFSIFPDLTNVAIENCKSEYHFQIQADEVVHEKYLRAIRSLVTDCSFDCARFGVLHFYSSFKKVYKPGVFYDSFIRLARRSIYPIVKSCDDAMTLGCPTYDHAMLKIENRTDIILHHYGYVRKPLALINKQDNMNKLWGVNRDELFEKALENGKVDWTTRHAEAELDDYLDTHPRVLHQWIANRECMVTNGTI